MRSTETAPMLVAASSAIQEAPAAAELTTDERAFRVRVPMLCGFAMVASAFLINACGSSSFLLICLSRFRARQIETLSHPRLDT
jgi:hypothetical protein